ncbi:MAG: hypothetical protein LC115_01045 [Bacteroidia bacterium]|nr:hypothetical protein [Bacteroidia bacterium]
MALISRKKRTYRITLPFMRYLRQYGRVRSLPVKYASLLRYTSSISLYDKSGQDTLWSTVFYPEQEMYEIHDGLRRMYAILKNNGDESLVRHLYVDRIDVCDYGNTTPFRIRIVNRFNENFDYYYVKRADASRVYGLELEDLLSPNRINYVVHDEDTLIEEHIAGIPGEIFIKQYLSDKYLDTVRLTKEFIKFNERCFIRLLGDMHSNNFVVDITPDFEETNYRLRSIDFDQQCYEGKKNVYLPQFFKQNNPIIFLGMNFLTPEVVRQYQNEERTVMRYRIRTQRYRLKDLLDVMVQEELAPAENILQLGRELSLHYQDDRFTQCSTMGQILKLSLKVLLKAKH